MLQETSQNQTQFWPESLVKFHLEMGSDFLFAACFLPGTALPLLGLTASLPELGFPLKYCARIKE